MLTSFKIIGVQGLLAQPAIPTPTTENGGWDGLVNAPKIGTSGLIPVTINETTGAVTEIPANSTGWYEYKVQASTTPSGGDSHWANAITKNSGTDGIKGNADDQITGMFVWIPRFAYKITSGFNKSGDELQTELGKTAGTIDVVFLKGTTDKYEVNGQEYQAHRVIENNTNVDVETNYVVHPCFTKTEANGVKTYEQGEWDEELEGIWVAKFEAGYAGSTAYSGATAENSGVKYTYVNSSYPKNYHGSLTTNIEMKKPVFLPKAYSYNWIDVNDIYSLSRTIGNDENTYYNLSDVDSHMMKNSEWGAVAYLGQSQYGRKGTEVTINNVYLWEEIVGNRTKNVCAITGYGGSSVSAAKVESIPGSAYEWTGSYGKLASTTGNVYGIYDMSGGLYEYTAAYTDNPDDSNSRSTYGSSLVNEEEGRYKTIYVAHSNDYWYDNWSANPTKRGDALYETSKGTQKTAADSWNYDYSYFPFSSSPFFHRGGHCVDTAYTGVFAFYNSCGVALNYCGWRAVLI